MTHQIDTEQRVIEKAFLHDHVQPNRLVLTPPTAAAATGRDPVAEAASARAG